MKVFRIGLATALSVLGAALALSAGWDPEAFSKESTLDYFTVGPGGDEHWSRVWLVVIDGQVYIRLGKPAARRIEENTRAPIVKVRIAGQELDDVRAEPAPDMAERVAAAMAEKYWTDLLIHYFPHPLTVRLTLEERALAE